MVARTILFKMQDEAARRIEAHARSIGGDHPDIVEAAERVKNAKGLDEQHTRVFHLQAIADLLEKVDEVTSGKAADPLEGKSVKELREIAKEEGVGGSVSQMNKHQLLDEIRANREAKASQPEEESRQDSEDDSGDDGPIDKVKKAFS